MVRGCIRRWLNVVSTDSRRPVVRGGHDRLPIRGHWRSSFHRHSGRMIWNNAFTWNVKLGQHFFSLLKVKLRKKNKTFKSFKWNGSYSVRNCFMATLILIAVNVRIFHWFAFRRIISALDRFVAIDFLVFHSVDQQHNERTDYKRATGQQKWKSVAFQSSVHRSYFSNPKFSQLSC